jgi:hypothetical protein
MTTEWNTGGEKTILIGRVPAFEMSKTEQALNEQFPFMYAPGPSEAGPCIASTRPSTQVPRFIRLNQSGSMVNRSTQDSVCMRGEHKSALSTGRFFGSGRVPKIQDCQDLDFKVIQDTVDKWDILLQSHTQELAQEFVEGFIPSLFKGRPVSTSGAPVMDSSDDEELPDGAALLQDLQQPSPVASSSKRQGTFAGPNSKRLRSA